MNTFIELNLKRSLMARLSNAEANCQSGSKDGTLNQLEAFVDQVEAQSGYKIDEALADAFIEDAEAIYEAIENAPNMPSVVDEEKRVPTAGTSGMHIDSTPIWGTGQGEVRLEYGFLLKVTWDQAGTLQENSDLSGEWDEVEDAVSPYWSEDDGPQKFYRVRSD